MDVEELAGKFALLWPHLDERQRRLWLGVEAQALGRGGITAVARAAVVSRPTVRKGLAELTGGAVSTGRVPICRRPSKTACRAVFKQANGAGGLSAAGVWGVVKRAVVRAGLASGSAHRLRHSAGTAMLRAGASLSEVGQVLRQRSSQVTAHYAKVDFAALRAVALPWPECVA